MLSPPKREPIIVMQRPHFGILVIFFAATTAGGCVPATYVEVPALRGRVVDAGGRPVSDAVVQVVRDVDHTQMATFPASADGTFCRPQQGNFTFQFAGADRVLTTYSVTAVAGSRRSPTTQVNDGIRRWFLGYYDPPLDRDLDTLRLR